MDNKKVIKVEPIRPMGGPPHMFGSGVKAKDLRSSISKLSAYLKPYWNKIIVVVIFALLSTTFAIIGPKIMGQMTDQLLNDLVDQMAYDRIIEQIPDGMSLPEEITGEDLMKIIPDATKKEIPEDMMERIKEIDLTKRPELDWSRLSEFALILILLYLSSTLFSYVQGFITTDVIQKVTLTMRKEISEKINRLPLKYFDKNSFGDVLSRITNDVDTISQSLNQSLTQVITSISTLIGILIMMLSISPLMTLIAVVALPVSFGIIALIVRRTQKYFKSQQDSLGKLNGYIEEMYSGHNIVKVYNGEEKAIEIFDRTNRQLYKSAWKSQFFSSLMFPITNIISNIDYVAVAIVGGNLAIKGEISIGDIQAFIQYVRQFNQPIVQTANAANLLQSMAASSERVFEFLEEKEEVEDAVDPVVLKSIKGDVEFSNVHFGYDTDVEVIKGFSLKVKKGQRIAIVGPTGAGKTTLVNLLMRFYDVDAGVIKIDGVDINKMRKKDLRKIFGMVLQDTWLFKGSIKQNLLYGKLDATEDEIIQAARSAYVDHFVRSLPGGYEMELNEEASNISQGEKQLLTIARAMLADPPILILDEATSNVDTRTEVLIQEAMDKLMHGRTSFIIAHRLSTIRNADIILYLHEGNIVEQGSHKELLDKDGYYASLYNSQFKDID